MFIYFCSELFADFDLFVVSFNKTPHQFAKVIFIYVFLFAVLVFSSCAVIVHKSLYVTSLLESFEFVPGCNSCTTLAAPQKAW